MIGRFDASRYKGDPNWPVVRRGCCYFGRGLQ